jgi:mRNA-degrading endonuclease RelE of RelBE toxin-antitoxin system
LKKPDPKPGRVVLQAPRFGKAKRKLPATAQLEVDEAVKRVVADPLIGEPKVGALRGVRVVKFKVETLQLLLAYQFDAKKNLIEALDVGPHENFYRELKDYLDARVRPSR